MAESEVVRIAREYRDQLARNEDEALKRMASVWVNLESEIQPFIESLAADVTELAASGQPVLPQYIYTLDRYQALMAQIQKQMPYYQSTIDDLITEYQRKDYELGLDCSNAVLQASAGSVSWNKVPIETVEIVAGFSGNGAPLYELLQTDYGDLGSRITDALISGVTLGKGAGQTAKMMEEAMGFESSRWLRIARTEMNRAYRIANAEQYQKSGVVEKVFRLCYPPTACLACLEMDGEECPNGMCDDHPNGKCTTVVQTIGGSKPEWQSGHDWLMEQDEATQRRIMGNARYEMWQNEGVPLRDMVEMKDNPVWGGSPSTKAVYSLREEREGLN